MKKKKKKKKGWWREGGRKSHLVHQGHLNKVFNDAGRQEKSNWSEDWRTSLDSSEEIFGLWAFKKRASKAPGWSGFLKERSTIDRALLRIEI